MANIPGTNRDRLEALDLLRVIAVLAVLLYHYTFRGAAADGLTDVSLPGLVFLSKYGSLGVQLFFVISGFVIAYSAEGRTPADFAIARVSRIYPAFLFCMTVTFLVALAIGAPRFEVTVTQWFANLLIVSPFLKQPFMDGAYWSIVNEITFYGWVFVLMAVGLFRRELASIILVWVAISIANETALQSGFLRRLFVTDQSGFFCAGLVLYEIYCGKRGRDIMLMLTLAALTAVNQAFIGAALDQAHYQVEFSNVVLAGISLASIGAVALAMHVRLPRAWSGIVLALGGMTYPMYLLHQHVGYMLLNRFAAEISPGLLVMLAMLTVLTASFLVWRIFERPAQRWLKAVLRRGLSSLGAHLKVPAPRVLTR
jgi:peptidoglycan/LPS O-acetylase OafA/YrhL